MSRWFVGRADFRDPRFLTLCFVGIVGLIIVGIVGWLT